MHKWPGGFRAALGTGWAALAVAGGLYARAKGIPVPAALPVIAAFLIAYPFYLVTGFPAMRERLAGPRLKWLLVVSMVLPYMACCCGAIEFHWYNLIRLAAVALTIGLWYVALPVNALTDLAFLAVVAAVVLAGFDSIYPPYMGQKLNVLGHVTLLPVVVLVLLLERRVRETGYGFIPNRREWRIGAVHYLYFLPIGGGAAFLLHAAQPHEPAALWKIAGTFLGFLWVIGLSEEFFFRGVLQQWIEDWTGSGTAALAIASAVFGLAHLGFPGFPSPNWRWALLAGIMGWFCGHARNQAGSIRAGVVTHALVVTTLRAFLR